MPDKRKFTDSAINSNGITIILLIDRNMTIILLIDSVILHITINRRLHIPVGPAEVRPARLPHQNIYSIGIQSIYFWIKLNLSAWTIKRKFW